MFSSKSFIVSHLLFGSLMHFDYIFVYGVRKCSNFIPLQIADQFPQHCLLKRVSFLHYALFASFFKDKVCISAWVYFWAFCLVPLVYISVFVPVPCCLDDCGFVVRKFLTLNLGMLIPPTPFFFLKTALAIWGLFCFPRNHEIFVLVL